MEVGGSLYLVTSLNWGISKMKWVCCPRSHVIYSIQAYSWLCHVYLFIVICSLCNEGIRLGLVTSMPSQFLLEWYETILSSLSKISVNEKNMFNRYFIYTLDCNLSLVVEFLNFFEESVNNFLVIIVLKFGTIKFSNLIILLSFRATNII